MAKKNGARQQKRVAKLKAKRLKKRSLLQRRDSKDPTILFQTVEKWTIVQTLAGSKIWTDGMGYLTIMRQGPDGRLVFAAFLVDVNCLGVKNAFWRTGTRSEFEDVIQQMGRTQTMRPITPACLVKTVQGAVDYAQSFGFPPHPDYRHASRLLEGIDPSGCKERFQFGRDGKPFYIQGPNESPAQVEAIMQRVQAVGGHFFVAMPGTRGFPDTEDAFVDFDSIDEDDSE
jgi:hypothetical protein